MIKDTKKRYPSLDLEWFDFTDKRELCVCPKKVRNINAYFELYGLRNKIDLLVRAGIIEKHKRGHWQTKFIVEEAEIFFKELITVCGYLLFPCYTCNKYYQLEDLYFDKYGYYEKQTAIKQLASLDIGRCKRCSDEKVEIFKAPRSYEHKVVNKGGRWKGTYKLSYGGGGLRD